MKNTTSAIQTLFKIGKAFSRLIFIFCIVGLVLCFAAVILPNRTLTIGTVTIHGLMPAGSTVSCFEFWIGIIVLAAAAIAGKIAEICFKRAQEAGQGDGSCVLTSKKARQENRPLVLREGDDLNEN